MSGLIGEGKLYELEEDGSVKFIDSEVEPVKLVGEIGEVRISHTARYPEQKSWWRKFIGKLKRFCEKEKG